MYLVYLQRKLFKDFSSSSSNCPGKNAWTTTTSVCTFTGMNLYDPRPDTETEIIRIGKTTCPQCGFVIDNGRAIPLQITARQIQILQAIAAHILSNGKAPSIRALTRAVNLPHSSSVAASCKSMESKGILTSTPNKSCSIRITERGYTILRKVSEKVRS